MNKPITLSQASIVHEVSNSTESFRHRLVVNGIAGHWATYTAIARFQNYCGIIQDYWGFDIPRVYVMQPVEFSIYDHTNPIQEG